MGETRTGGMGRQVRGGGLLIAPATAYMSAVAEACARIAIERAPGIDSLEILSMFMGFPTYGSTQTIFGQLQWESIYLEQNEYKLWPPVTTLEVSIPSAIATQLALPGAASRIRSGSRTTRRLPTCVRSEGSSTAP